MDGSTRIAQKDHICSFCALPIPKGARYWYEKMTPWDHEDNDGFFTCKAHEACRELWVNVASDFEYRFPDDPFEWRRMLGEENEASEQA